MLLLIRLSKHNQCFRIKFCLTKFLIIGLFLISGGTLFSQSDLPVKNLSFTGNDSIVSRLLLKQMNTKPAKLTGTLFGSKKNEGFSYFIMDEDITRLKEYYQQNGFLNPLISYELKSNKKNKKVSIQINVKEGKSIEVGQIEYLLINEMSSGKILDSLKKVLPVKSGMRFRDADILQTENLIKNGFTGNGYPFIKVKREIELIPGKEKANLRFIINPGIRSYIGDIELKGDSLIPRKFILKHIGIKKGDLFSTIEIEKTRNDIVDLGLFRYVITRALTDSISKNQIPVLLQVKELPRWSLKTGLGYGTEDKFRLSLLLTRLNFLGGARTMIIKGQHSYFNPINIDFKFIQPDLFGNEIELIVNPYFSKEREESYGVRRFGTAVTLQKEFSEYLSTYISYSLGNDKVTAKENIILDSELTEQTGNNKSGISFGIENNSSDDLFFPTKGSKIKGTATYMGLDFNSRYHYYKLIIESSWYHTLADNIVFAWKLNGGLIEATGNDLHTPIEDRFLMGGATSLRGWGRHQLSPLDENGNKVGGNTMLESSIELRFPVYKIFSGATFIDAGNVWKEAWKVNFSNFNYNLGLGLRVKTPVGPIRLDMATPLFNGKPRPQFFITIGHAF